MKKGGAELDILRRYRGSDVDTRKKYLGIAWLDEFIFTYKGFNKYILIIFTMSSATSKISKKSKYSRKHEQDSNRRIYT